MKVAAIFLSILFSVSSVTASADGCEGSSSESNGVEVRYLGSTMEKVGAYEVERGRFAIKNQSSQPLQFSGYKGRPVTLYLHDTYLERQIEGESWESDVTVLEEPLPPTARLKLMPGKELEFVGIHRDDHGRMYRLKVRPTNGCWFTSDPFQFGQAKASK
jgi:hypothetical protein